MSEAHIRLPKNTNGRDFIVGDIHGEYGKLVYALEKVKFNNDCDRLISVGDLADRGRDSLVVVKLFHERENFFAVRGNHEQMCLDSHNSSNALGHFLINGGAWYAQLEPFEQGFVAGYFSSLPYAITIETDYGDVGVVHAQPYGLDWPRFIELLESDHRTLDVALWSRSIVSSGRPVTIEGVKQVYCGHTVVPEALTLGNINFIDTGACFGGKITLVQVQP